MFENDPAFDDLLRGTALVAVVLAGGWGVAVLAAVVLEAATDGRMRLADRLGCPPGCHRWLLVLASAVVATTLSVPPAGAEEHRAPTRTVIDGLPLPDRAAGGVSPMPHPNPRAREPPTVSAWVTVLPGDSLWEISRRLLPADAPLGSVADLTRSLYAHNVTTIGADPDLIRPGQRLHVPPAPHETYSEDS